MEQFRKLSQICRQHYEKLILSLALLIFAGAVWWLFEDSKAQRAKIREIPGGYDNQKVKPVHRVDLSANEAALQQAGLPATANFSHPHFLFNPLVWESRSGSEPRKIKGSDDIGPKAMCVVKVSPLNLTIAYGSPSISGEGADVKVNGYWTFSTNELVGIRSPQRLVRAFVSEAETNKQALFFLRGVKGDPREPAELLGELKDPPGTAFTFAPNKPFLRVLGHEAELRYKPNTNRPYLGLRIGAPVDIDGQIYKVVDINPGAVVLSDDSNGKQYSITTFCR